MHYCYISVQYNTTQLKTTQNVSKIVHTEHKIFDNIFYQGQNNDTFEDMSNKGIINGTFEENSQRWMNNYKIKDSPTILMKNEIFDNLCNWSICSDMNDFMNVWKEERKMYDKNVSHKSDIET